MTRILIFSLASLIVSFGSQAWTASAFQIAPIRTSSVRSIDSPSTERNLITRRFPHVELATTLKRLDKSIQSQIITQPWTRWNKFVVQQRFSLIGRPETDFVYVLEPPAARKKIPPSCVIVFTGGAGLGSYPHISYNEFLMRLSDQLNAVVVSAPYQIQLDHFELARKTGNLYDTALEKLIRQRNYPSNLPVFNLSHSLGSKLSCIYSAASPHSYQGLGFISFNNFGFGKTISMAKSFTEKIKQSHNEQMFENFFKMADFAVSASGIEFTPSPFEMERLILRRFNRSNRLKTRLFTFSDDDLCSGSDFFKTCQRNGHAPQISHLPGNHLTPVFINGLQDHEHELNFLVDEVTNWILGKEPTTTKLLLEPSARPLPPQS